MKRLIIFISTVIVATNCSAQWQNASMGAQIYVFGVHDTSLFIGINPAGTPAPLVWRLVSLVPNVVWTIADNGMDPTQGNVTSFASLGPYFFAGFTHTNTNTVGPMYETTNNGSNWSDIQAAAPTYSNGRYLFGNGLSSAYRSRDSGAVWDVISCPEASNYASIGICIFANAGSGIMRSYDTGNTWSQISPPFLGRMTVMGTLVFIPGNGKLAVSTDSGTQWTTVPVDSAGVPEMVNCLATDGKNLFAGTPTGVLVSTDTGRDWQAENDSLANKNITNIGVFDSLLFIDVTTNGSYAAYYRPISEMTKPDSPASVVQIAQPGDSIEVYPNPASGIVTIFSGGTSILGVSVLNVLGEAVLDMPNLRESDVTLDISQLASGTYFLRIETANGSVLRKIIRE